MDAVINVSYEAIKQSPPIVSSKDTPVIHLPSYSVNSSKSSCPRITFSSIEGIDNIVPFGNVVICSFVNIISSPYCFRINNYNFTIIYLISPYIDTYQHITTYTILYLRILTYNNYNNASIGHSITYNLYFTIFNHHLRL